MATNGPSRVEAKRAASGAPSIPTIAATFACMAGITEMGPIGACNAAQGDITENQPITSFANYRRIYGGFTANARELPLQAKLYFDEGGQRLFVSRVVHTTTLGDPTTRTSTAGTLTLSTAAHAATAAFSLGTAASTYALTSGQFLSIIIDANGAVSATFTGVAAQRDSTTGPFALANNDVLNVTITSTNGVVAAVITFITSAFANIAAATATEVVAVMNAYFSANNVGATALVVSNTVRIKTTLAGLGASVNVTGGNANAGKLAYTTGAVAGTGNVQDISKVTHAELKTIVEAATSASCTVSSPSNVPTITSNTTGGSSIVQVRNTSTALAFGFDNASHTGGASGTLTTLRLDARWDGTYANGITVVVRAATGGASDRFDLALFRSGIEVETWRNASLDPDDVLGYIVTLINLGAGTQRASVLVTATDLLAAFPSPLNLPDVGTFGPMTGGGDGLVGLTDSDFGGAKTVNGATGLRVFNRVRRIDLAALPGRATASAQNQLVTWCEIDREGHTFFVLGPPAGFTAAQIRGYVENTAGLKGVSELGVLAWPRILVDNPDTSVFGSAPTLLVSPEGQYMGVCALVDKASVGGAFKPPSNALGQIKTGRGVETLEVEDPQERGLCQDALIITIRSNGGRVYIDGARCLKDTGPFPTVGESRGVMFVQNQILEEFEDLRNSNLGTKLYNTLTSASVVFLRDLTDHDCFLTKVYKEAFFVDYGKGLNNAAAVEAREAIGVLGLNTAPPAEIISVTVVPFRGLVQQFQAA